ncbi:MAG TPA: ATP-binding protein [Kofleriaceae bacterium]
MSTRPRLSRSLALARSGRFVAFRQADELHVVDTIGPAPRRRYAAEGGDTLAWLGEQLWWTDRAGALRHAGRDGVVRPVGLDAPVDTIVGNPTAAMAVVEGADAAWLLDATREPKLTPCDRVPGTRTLAFANRQIVEAHGATVAIRTLGQRTVVSLGRLDGVALGAAFVLANRAVAIWLRRLTDDAIVTFTTTGKLIHRTLVRPLVACVFAEEANLAFGLGDGKVGSYDLRYGATRATCPASGIVELDVDRHARQVVTATRCEEGALEFATTDVSRLFVESVPASEVVDVVDVPEVPEVAASVLVDPPANDEVAADPGEPPAPEPLPIALAPALAPTIEIVVTDGAQPYRDPGEHLSAVLDVVAARVALAIAQGWHSGTTSRDAEGDLPCEREVLGLLGEEVGLAADALRRARTRLLERATELSSRTEATVAARIALPLHEIVREHGLSPTATQILVCAAAPRLRASIARLYGVLGGLMTRSMCAEHLLDALVETAAETDAAQAIARELSPEAPLVRTRLVTLVPIGDRIELAVDAVLVDRLRDIARVREIGDATVRRPPGPALDEIVAPVSVKRRLLAALATRDPDHPVRLVVRGRRGSGRHTIVAALARRVDREIAEVDCGRLPRGAQLAGALATELARAQLAGCLPMVSGLDRLDPADADLWRQVENVLRHHVGALAVRAAPDSELPLDPDRIDVVLPPLSLSERAAMWARALAGHGLPSLDDAGLGSLSARFRFGPGTILRIMAHVARRALHAPCGLPELIEEVARQYVAGRLERVATRVTRLPEWDQVSLVDDMRDSVRELIGRMQHQRTVYEEWGFDRRITTARGVTALFYGPPGTGKTLVAGLIGRELELDVWRIDLARVMSKWVGETEKQLGEVFEAAEEGQVLLLFDEADSLFGKRSEVKSSNDRYANLETNYLLQRLDTFEGVAILTTNLEGSIDPAFKRRLSMRLCFPFPDEEQREQLWAAHVPQSTPRGGTLDFADLARRFPLSGGYIRNSALRAAFLAAQERRPLAQDHLVRAVELEYRGLGKLSNSGRMD